MRQSYNKIIAVSLAVLIIGGITPQTTHSMNDTDGVVAKGLVV